MPFAAAPERMPDPRSPLVSAVIIFLNGERFLREAIESVFAQTYRHWELLLVDDGSTDASTMIALEYARANPDRVQYLEHLHHQNLGKSASRNLGLRHAAGKYIGHLDADDVWLPYKLERQVAVLESMPDVVMACSRSQIWFSWKGPEYAHEDQLETPPMTVDTLVEPPALAVRTLQRRGVWPTICGELMRRDVVDRVGGSDERFRNVLEHGVLSAKMFLAGPIWLSGECLARYRQHETMGSRSAARTLEWSPHFPNPAQHAYVTWVTDYAAERGIRDRTLAATLRKASWPYRHPWLWKARHRAEQYRQRMAERLANLWRTASRLAIGRSTGEIRADPNPVEDWSGQVATTLSWVSRRTTAVQVRIGSPDGKLFTHSTPSGHETTGKWARDGLVFHLQDVSDGRPLTSENTLATVTMEVRGSVKPADLAARGLR